MKLRSYLESNPAMLLAPVLASLGLFLAGWAVAHPLEIRVDGVSHQIRTHAQNPATALMQVGALPAESDSLSPGWQAPIRDLHFIELRRAQPIRVDIDGDTNWVESAALLPANLLQSMEVRLLPGDQLWVDGLPYSVDQGPLNRIPDRVKLERGKDVTVETGASSMVLRTAAPSIAEALVEDGKALYEGDQILPSAVAPPDLPAGFRYLSSQPVEIVVGSEKPVRARVAADEVGQALRQAGVALLGLDYARPAITQSLPSDGPIQVTRVREEVMVELEPVAFETNYQPLPEVEIDNQRIIETGSYGVRADQVRVRYENGEEVQRTVEGNWLAREPEPRVVGYGTNIVVRTTSTADGPIEYWRAVEMWATSYSPSRAGVPDDYEYFGITASGKRLEKGLVAIDRSLIPFGTMMYVPGYGYAEAADTGGGVKGLWIDLGYEDDNWVSWAQYVTVYFLTPVPPASNITYILP